MRIRLGRGRSPDPTRQGTVYRAGPGFRLRSDSPRPAGPGRATPSPPAPQSGGQWTAGHAGPATALGRPRVPRQRRSLRPRRLVTVLLVLVIAYPLLLAGLAWFSLQRVEAIPSGDRAPSAAGHVYLVIGSDSREDLTREEQAQLGTGQATGIRTDTIMLLQTSLIGPDTLVSIPRDSYVDIPGHGKDKINAAYSLGGPTLLVSTVEQNTGLRVDDVVMTGLGGFAEVVDAIDGVRVCPKTAMNDEKAHIDIEAGCQMVDGKTALGYARARYSDPQGDLGRVKRQREVLAAIASKTLSPSVILLPWRAVPAAIAGGSALTVNNGMMPWSLGGFVLGMRAVSGEGGATLTVPIGGDVTTSSGAAALSWKTEEASRLFTAMSDGDHATIAAIAAEQAKAT